MKNKTIWIIVGVIVLLIAAYFIYKKMNTATITINAPSIGLSKRILAPLPGSQSDYSAIDEVTGKPIWIHKGILPCPLSYTKATRTEDAGWCKMI